MQTPYRDPPPYPGLGKQQTTSTSATPKVVSQPPAAPLVRQPSPPPASPAVAGGQVVLVPSPQTVQHVPFAPPGQQYIPVTQTGQPTPISLAQAGTRKSFSGSETSTDVSLSSTENLSTLQRQEPQGEETKKNVVFLPGYGLPDNTGSSSYSILQRLGMPPSALANLLPQSENVTVRTAHEYVNSTPSRLAWQSAIPSSSVNADISPISVTSGLISSPYSHQTQQLSTPPHPPYLQHLPYSAQHVHSVNNPHLISGYSSNLHGPPQPPEYSDISVTSQEMLNYDNGSKDMKRSFEMLNFNKAEATRSQPDLSKYLTYSQAGLQPSYCTDLQYSNGQNIHQLSNADDWDHAIAARASQMVEMLSEENRVLRADLNLYERKVSILQKFELEIQRVHESYEDLVKSSNKRERLQLALKKRMEDEIKKLKIEKTELREQLETSLKAAQKEWSAMNEADLKVEIAKREAQIIELGSKNNDLMSSHERLDSEVLEQRNTVQEYQRRTDMLDSALAKAQANVARLEDDSRKKQVYVTRVDQLQRALSVIQNTQAKQEYMHKQIQDKMDQELDLLRGQMKSSSEKPAKKSSERKEDVASLKRQMTEKDARILQLEAEVLKKEQKLLEEYSKQLTLDGEPKESRLAALSHNSRETEKLISDAKAEKLRSMEELYHSNRKLAELESQIKSLETQLSEKEAMIKVLQRSTMTRSSSVHSIYCSPVHSPRSSLVSQLSGTLTRGSSQSSGSNTDTGFSREYSTIKHIKTSSAGALDMDSKPSSNQSSQPGSDEDVTRVWHL